jgi:hypothetical protein
MAVKKSRQEEQVDPGKWECPKCKLRVTTYIKTYVPICRNPKKHVTSPCVMERVK